MILTLFCIKVCTIQIDVCLEPLLNISVLVTQCALVCLAAVRAEMLPPVFLIFLFGKLILLVFLHYQDALIPMVIHFILLPCKAHCITH